MKKIVLPMIGILALSACGKTVSKEEVMIKRFEYNTEKVEQTSDDIPKWFVKIPQDTGFTYAVGTSETPDLQMSIDLAVMNAKTTLADSMNSRLRSQTKSFISKLGSDDLDSSVISEVDKATRNIVLDADVSGWQQKEMEIQPSGTQYRVYVLLEYSDARAQLALHRRLSADKMLLSKIASSKAFKELDQVVEEVQSKESKDIDKLVNKISD